MALRSRQTAMLLPMRVWDAPIRLFHWLVVVLVPAAYITMKGGFPRAHLLIGYTMLALLLFRLAWGLIGSDTARFARFLASPLAGLRHLRRLTRREADTEVGHNAAGGWMVLLMLLLLAVQVATGLCASTGHGTEGPLARHLDAATVKLLSRVHALNFKLIFAAAVAHVLVIGVYLLVKRQNLIRPMITGKKRLPAATRAPRLASPLLALVVLAAAVVVAVLIATEV
jgi:cytochrome b